MTPVMICTSNLTRLEDIKTDIRSLLISEGSHDITLPKLNTMYKDITDDNIPFKDFNYTSLKEFLKNMPDVLSLRYNKANQLCAYHIDTKKSQHISSLIAKQKKQSHFDKCRSKANSIRYNNSIDPHILHEVLQELINSSVCRSGRISISKTNLLNGVINRIGVYTFYTMDNLNNQLNEFTHILNYDDDNIYFKDALPKCKVKNQKGQKSIQRVKEENNSSSFENIKKQKEQMLLANSIGVFIKESTQIRLQKLVEKHIEGIWCSELPTVYQREYGLELEYTDLGFNSIIEFVAALPNIFQIVKPASAKKQMVLDARIPVDNFQNHDVLNSNLHKFAENEANDPDPIPTRLSSEVSKTLIAENVMSYDDTVDQISVTSLFADSEKCVDAIVSEVHSPSFFWITLRKNKRKINKLMNQLQEFYTQQDLDKYKIPQIILQPGLHIACIFAEMWHRGIIKKIKPNGLVILFYDYGTVSTYKPNQLYFLDKRFSFIAAQAIPCGMHNIKPIGDNKWSREVSKVFVKQVMEKPLIASICSINEENNSMIIDLIDVSSDEEDIYIDEWMVLKRLAEWGELVCSKSNVTFKHYKQCMQRSNSYVSNCYCTKTIIEFENKFCHKTSKVTNGGYTSNYISSDKKLEALKNYKAKYSNTSNDDFNDGICEENNSQQILKTDDKLLEKQIIGVNDNDLDDQMKKDKDYLNENNQNNKTLSLESNDVIEDFSSLSYSLSSTISPPNSPSNKIDNSNDVMFKSCSESLIEPTVYTVTCSSNNKNQIICKTHQKNISKTLKELQKLIISTKF